MEVIVFPDVEAALVTYLTAELANHGRACPVSTQVPNPRPAEFVTIPRKGGTRQTLVSDAATIAVECYAATGALASTLAALVRGLIAALPGTVSGGVTFYRVGEFAGPAMLPDPVSEQSRYVYTASVHFRGTAIA